MARIGVRTNVIISTANKHFFVMASLPPKKAFASDFRIGIIGDNY
jgi:hypothetical protein